MIWVRKLIRRWLGIEGDLIAQQATDRRHKNQLDAIQSKQWEILDWARAIEEYLNNEQGADKLRKALGDLSRSRDATA